MNANIKKILKKIEANGFEAYIIGGYVRDHLLGIHSYDVDIATNALLKQLKDILPSGKCDEDNYGSYHLKLGPYNVDITTYREEYKYQNRRPTKIVYVHNLLTDIKRRDFTMNSLCMNSKGDIIDLLDAKRDILAKEIKVLGDIETKFRDDPLRMLRAIRFSITLGFKIEDKALEFIKNNKNLIKSLSYQRKKNELAMILISDNVLFGLEFLKELELLEILEIDYDQVIKVPDLLGMWAQLDIYGTYPWTNVEKNNLKSIKEIVSYGKIDNEILFNYNLYLCLVAGSILGIDRVKIYEMDKKMPIHHLKDIDITVPEIIKLLDIKPSKVIGIIMNDLKLNILNGKLKNKNKIIRKYILEKRSDYIEK